MALPGTSQYHRYGVSQLDLPDSMGYYPEQLLIPAPRGSRSLAARYGLHSPSQGHTTQPFHGSTQSAYPPIHVHAGGTLNATIYMNVYPDPSTSFSNNPLYSTTTTTSSSTQCRYCDYRFDAPYLLTAHKSRNSLHCACCRQCFASWPDHFHRNSTCGSRTRDFPLGDEDLGGGHSWSAQQHHDYRGGGRVLGEVDDLDLRIGGGGGGGLREDAYYGPEGWVVEERRRRSRRRRGRSRGRSRGRYGATSAWRSYFL